MNLIFLGPPGAGKGTQCAHIVEDYGVRQLSTGELLRKNIREGTPIGIEADKYISHGNLIPDDLMIGILKEELQRGDYIEKGCIFDGFPRTVPQAEALIGLLEEFNTKLDVVVVLEVPRSELVERLTARRTCKDCGRVYHLKFNPPKNEGFCDAPCGGELFQRDDDSIRTVLQRLEVYKNQTEPLLEFYEQRNQARRINGVGSLEHVYDRIREVLSEVE
jgi:adenylate kinase